MDRDKHNAHHTTAKGEKMPLVSNDPYFIKATTPAQKQGQAPSNDFQGLSQPLQTAPSAGGIDPAAAFTELDNRPLEADPNNPKIKYDPNNPATIPNTTQFQKQLSELEKNQKTLESNPNAKALNPQEFFKTTYELGQRNTGIAYFDNKKDLTLLDAYIAHKLGLKTSRIEHKIDIKSDNKHRVDSLTKMGDNSTNNSFLADTFMLGYATNVLNDKSNFTGMVSQVVRDATKGILGVGSAAEKAANNSIINASAYQSGGFSRQLNQSRIEMHAKEYYQGDSIKEKGQVIKVKLLAARNGLVANVQRAQASGALEHAAKDIAKIKEIDAYINLINTNNYQGILEFIQAKGNYTPMMADSSDRSMAEQSF